MILDFLNPKQIIENLSFLKPQMTALDIGSGSGGWTIPLAKKLENGKVYALDIKEEALSALRSKLDGEKIGNVELLLADVEKGVKIADNRVDFIILSNILFLLNDKKKVFEEIKRILKPEGYLLIVDWKKVDNIGPQIKAISKEEIKEIANEFNLELEEELDLNNYHFALIFRK
ncbi:MAG: class I SAM-dependent methyltransferase [Candidatus Pacebacteria bacterium]|nr:class I SAM-dependent methyltransferase [Candidatus Paceibacterota bacterium]MDD3919433.1 class I SAM-dependent methyltransferase [Candidatus Paceibacterota bacterium]